MKISVFVLTLLFAFPVMAQKSKGKTEEVLPVAVSEGITYALPRTGIRIIVKASQTHFVAGPYAIYADPLLGIREVITQSKTIWEILNISFEPFAEPDPSKIFKTSNMAIPLVHLTPDGIINGFNVDQRSEDMFNGVSNSFTSNGNLVPPWFSKTFQLPSSSGRTSVEQRAEEAAGIILKARAARNEIVAGMMDEFHPDGKAYEESLNELRHTEKETLELFTGKHHTGEYTFTFIYVPVAGSVKGEVVFRFDENLGFLAKNDFSGKPVMIDVEAEAFPPAPAQGVTSLTSGLFYRQPGVGNIRLTKELTLIGTARLPIAQFGNILAIPAELLNGGYSIEFNPETGGLKSISKK